MMRVPSAFWIVSAMLAAGIAMAPARAAPVALSALEPGQWDLVPRASGGAPIRICVHDGLSLIQIKHPGQNCRQFVVEDSAERSSIAYSCPRTGHGRTVVRVETPRLVQIDSQGVADGYPFALDLEGRRTGNCTPMARK